MIRDLILLAVGAMLAGALVALSNWLYRRSVRDATAPTSEPPPRPTMWNNGLVSVRNCYITKDEEGRMVIQPKPCEHCGKVTE